MAVMECRARLRFKKLARVVPGCSSMGSPVRHVLVLSACVLVGWLLAALIGVLLYRSSLNSRSKEFALKCDNHKEVKLLSLISLNPFTHPSVLIIRVGVNSVTRRSTPWGGLVFCKF